MSKFKIEVETIDLATAFSATPLGRTRSQGRFSGEAFREDHLRKALSQARVVRVDLDGATGLSTGFLDEAFAGFIRDGSLTARQFFDRIKIIATRDPLVIDEIRIFVSRAAEQATAQ